MLRELVRIARARNFTPMSDVSLKTKLSRWENGKETVSAPYRVLFRELYAMTDEELGFPPAEVDESTEQFRERLLLARTVDAETVTLFNQQVEHARRLDRRLGGAAMLDQLRAQITQVSELMSFSTMNGQRQTLATALADASTLAGWVTPDRNSLAQAWEHHEVAKAAARETGSPSQLAHATAQQTFVLVELGETQAAGRRAPGVR